MMYDTATHIRSLAHQAAERIIGWRRHLHTYPELSFQEYQTAQYIAKCLQEMGLAPQPIANTGIVVEIAGKEPHTRCFALRADIDALPIEEANQVAYRSQNPGVMHACGHDAHTAALLGAAYILSHSRTHFTGTVRLLFQPGEELSPGGASLMIEAGALAGSSTTPAPQGILGQHVFPALEAGKVGFRSGLYMASADEIYLTVRGKGGHAALPEQNIDTVLVASHIIVALQQVVSRRLPPKLPAVLSFGKVIAQGATNVIPNEVYIEGTFRTFDEDWRYAAHEHIQQIAAGIARAMGAQCDVEIKVGYPFLYNNPALTALMKQSAEEYLGAEHVIDLDLYPTAEDFAFYSQVIPACFYRLGTRNQARSLVSGVHTPTFDIDEDALEIGAGLMAWLAINALDKDG